MTHKQTPFDSSHVCDDRLRKYGLALRGDSNASGSGIIPSFGAMLVECVDDHNSEVLSAQIDWRMWAVSGDNDDDFSLVTSGSFSPLSPNLGEEWKNWCVEGDVLAEDGRMSELALLQMKQILEGPLCEGHHPFLDSHELLSMRTSANKWNDACKCGELFVFP